jgi:flagellar FliL protein
MSKAAKPAAPEGGDDKPKSKKMLFIIIGVLVLVIGAGAAFMLMGSHGGAEEEEAAVQEEHAAKPVFVQLEPFTVNLQREEGDQFLQVGITLKVMSPTLEEEIKANLPEIRSKLLLLLSGKRASELSTNEGKLTLQEEIIADVNEILGAGETPEDSHGKKKRKKAKEGVEDVLFTSFIIQ